MFDRDSLLSAHVSLGEKERRRDFQADVIPKRKSVSSSSPSFFLPILGQVEEEEPPEN